MVKTQIFLATSQPMGHVRHLNVKTENSYLGSYAMARIPATSRAFGKVGPVAALRRADLFIAARNHLIVFMIRILTRAREHPEPLP